MLYRRDVNISCDSSSLHMSLQLLQFTAHTYSALPVLHVGPYCGFPHSHLAGASVYPVPSRASLASHPQRPAAAAVPRYMLTLVDLHAFKRVRKSVHVARNQCGYISVVGISPTTIRADSGGHSFVSDGPWPVTVGHLRRPMTHLVHWTTDQWRTHTTRQIRFSRTWIRYSL